MSEFYEETKQKGRDSSDRYRNCKILKDLDTKEVLISTREIDDIPLNALDIYHTVTIEEDCRLDLLADRYYNNPLMWWILAQANNIYDPLSKPKSGEIIRIPNLSTLYSNGGILL